MNTIRLFLMIRLYNWSSRIYSSLFKVNKKAWGLRKEDLVSYAPNSLGKALGDFYSIHGFDVMPKLENHDVFHVLTGTGIEIQDEIAMQYLLLGNGKFSLYLFAMVGLGTLMYPEFIPYYIRSYQRGSSMQRFYHLEFRDFLNQSLAELQVALLDRASIVNI